LAVAPQTELQRRRLDIAGVVQGVGFRPFVHRVASEHGLSGFVRNTPAGVTIEAEGPSAALDAFSEELVAGAPPLARVAEVTTRGLPVSRDDGFAIVASDVGAGAAVVPADSATCADCLRELFDPADRRYRHPFISCTHCGPRFTIVRGLPYDRARTTMGEFEMCGACRAEYEDPRDRRFHAEPIACHDCGPRLSMPLGEAIAVLRDGGIVAVKGLGGWHLACLATDEAAVVRLRERKQRDAKPFAVMSDEPELLARLSDSESALLCSAAAPIVLVERREGAPIAASVAPRSPWLGLLRPYTPLHHLLLLDIGKPLVMTSGNRGDEPIATGDEEARERLFGIADAFLGHDRQIERRCEDSIVRDGLPVRRSRGMVPHSLTLPVDAAHPVLAVGGMLKATFCVARGGQAFVSPHLGDLGSPLAVAAFANDLGLYLEMTVAEPEVVAHDLHPDYPSTRWALGRQGEKIAVQHHHAHAAACLAEHGECGPALAVVLDGSGYGTDGTLWGGELLRCDLRDFERVAHLAPVPLPGGEAAVREPWRMAAAYLEAAGRPVPWERWHAVRQSLAVNAPLASGAGRLLDAVAALLGVRARVSYEGQAAIELEQLAGATPSEAYVCERRGDTIVGADLVAAAFDDQAAGRPRAEIAAAVLDGLAEAFARACLAAGDPLVALSGGCLQNRRLARGLRARLEREGVRVLGHRQVPPGDGGLSYGQAAVAAARMS
jgi:hydrogenase maturation protein HypF